MQSRKSDNSRHSLDDIQTALAGVLLAILLLGTLGWKLFELYKRHQLGKEARGKRQEQLDKIKERQKESQGVPSTAPQPSSTPRALTAPSLILDEHLPTLYDTFSLKKREPRTSPDKVRKKEEKTAAVRAAQEAKQLDKDSKREEREARQAKQKEEKEKRQKQAPLRSSGSLPEASIPSKKVSQVKSSPTLLPSTYGLFTQDSRDRSRAFSRRALMNHAKQLLKITMDEADHPLVLQLSFLYHFLRYNLARTRLHVDIEDLAAARALRTRIVHCLDQIPLANLDLIPLTQRDLKRFMAGEVAHLSQIDNPIWVRSNPAMEELTRLAGYSVNHFTLTTIQSTALYQQFDAAFAMSPRNYETNPQGEDVYEIDALEFYQLARTRLLPFLIRLYQQSGLLNDHLRFEFTDAFQVAIVCIGEYCDENLARKFRHPAMRLPDVSEDQMTAIKNQMTRFIRTCRAQRNHISHAAPELALDRLSALYNIAVAIVPDVNPDSALLLTDLMAVTQLIRQPSPTHPLLAM